MHKWAFNEGVGSFQFDLNFFENEYFDAELDNLAVSVGKPVYFNVEMNGGKCSKFIEYLVLNRSEFLNSGPVLDDLAKVLDDLMTLNTV